jgi:hypothetical protein
VEPCLKFFFQLFFLLSVVSISSVQAIEIPNLTKEEIQMFSRKYREKLLKEKKTSREIQDMALQAAWIFEGKGKFKEFCLILKENYSIAKPTIEYASVLLGCYEHYRQKKDFNKVFSETFDKMESVPKDEADLDYTAESLRAFMRFNNKLSTELKPVHSNILKSEGFERVVRFNDSITLAQRKNYKKALELIEKFETNSDEDDLYVSYLQFKNDMRPSYCSRVSLQQPLEGVILPYKMTCSLMTSSKIKEIENEILSLKEVTKTSLLYKVIKGL